MEENKNEELKDWGEGIPEYTEDDLMEGLELNAFCTESMARYLQGHGFHISGLVTDKEPTQIIAEQGGKRYFIVVAGAVSPKIGKLSCKTKTAFSAYCNEQKIIPMLAPVGVKSVDPQRAEAGLALRYDRFYFDFNGLQPLDKVAIPTPNTDDYAAYCMELLEQAYRTADFSPLYSLFAANILFTSQWAPEPKVGSSAVQAYFEEKGRVLKASDSQIGGQVVIASREAEAAPILLGAEPKIGEREEIIGLLLSQKLGGKVAWLLILPEFDKNGSLTRLSLCDPSKWDIETYYTF